LSIITGGRIWNTHTAVSQKMAAGFEDAFCRPYAPIPDVPGRHFAALFGIGLLGNRTQWG
jgi:hypothetical protein